MSSAQTKVVLRSFGVIVAITMTGPLIYHLTANDVIFMYYLSFNAALNVVAYWYAIKAYFSAEFLSVAVEVLKDRTAPPVKKSLLKRIFRVS